MSESLKLDLGVLEDLGITLGRVYSNFFAADVIGDSIASLIGHQGLAHKVQDFANAWDDRREDIIGALGATRNGATLLFTEFTAVETALASALTNAGTASAEKAK